jgi:hypothetical protein
LDSQNVSQAPLTPEVIQDFLLSQANKVDVRHDAFYGEGSVVTNSGAEAVSQMDDIATVERYAVIEGDSTHEYNDTTF